MRQSRKRKKKVAARKMRQNGLYTTVHGSQMCGYVILSEGKKQGRPCSMYATPGSKFCRAHHLFQLEVEKELQDANARSLEPIDYSKKYCICNDTYQDGDFMIQCDMCNDWFHGECVGIEEEEGEKIDEYICKFCRGW
eukprot:CAMPEP_0167763366 /NCGR_PEP_ID=MMETSP0110_2-20121227/13323_1 /TAXON_ID=629695 /ORGANISM="Gymnochlora sp., Strain CCMP2014" /LENGTH=137 /DNA_ID=CAMNT_0007650423 /DNA_START=9 /DNA_END=425 /DNA_ORIENTATION=-